MEMCSSYSVLHHVQNKCSPCDVLNDYLKLVRQDYLAVAIQGHLSLQYSNIKLEFKDNIGCNTLVE